MGKTNKAQVEETTVEAVEQKHDVAMLMSTYKTKSGVIRYLDSQQMKRGDIAKLLNIRYQHVRNVLTQPLKTQATAASE